MNRYNDQQQQNNPRPENPQQVPPQYPQPNTQLYGENMANVQPESKPQRSSFKRVKAGRFSGLIGVTQIIVGAILAALFINTFVFQSYEVVGDSMYPTLHNGDRLIISKLGKSWDSLLRNEHLPKRGDIIVFDDPSGSKRQLVKRVIGLPGDRVEVERGVITVFNDENPSGFNPDLAYIDSLTEDTNYSLAADVFEDQLFVAGDNRIGGASFDSRNDLGLVDTDLIVGELVLRLLPLSDSRFF